jgi:hypothetical protein
MPPKMTNGNKTSAPKAKTEEKKKEKLIKDATFGLKNKKGASTQRQIKGIASAVRGQQKGGE